VNVINTFCGALGSVPSENTIEAAIIKANHSTKTGVLYLYMCPKHDPSGDAIDDKKGKLMVRKGATLERRMQ
jgi:hypothetical protein